VDFRVHFRRLVPAAAVLLLATAPTFAQTGANDRSAAYMASNCANCHGTAGVAAGAMPSLAGQKRDYLIEQMRAFRDGKRPATIMHQIAKGYSDEQIVAIAEHLSRQKPR
jgi:cytochrome c553